MEEGEWQTLLGIVREIQEWFPEGIAYIGGIAVYAHVSSVEATAQYAAMTRDADLMILLPDFADLRDIEVLTPNRRSGKQQFSKGGFEFDAHVEAQHDLPVPADEVVAWAEMRQKLRVACPEHLLILKLKAYEDRKGTAKGDMDEEDIFRLLLVRQEWRCECLTRLSDEMLQILDAVVAGDSPLRLTKGNLHEAKNPRSKASNSLAALKVAFAANYGGCGVS